MLKSPACWRLTGSVAKWAAITMKKRRPLLKGWKLYLVEILLA
jgi:hypothetical protein